MLYIFLQFYYFYFEVVSFFSFFHFSPYTLIVCFSVVINSVIVLALPHHYFFLLLLSLPKSPLDAVFHCVPFINYFLYYMHFMHMLLFLCLFFVFTLFLIVSPFLLPCIRRHIGYLFLSPFRLVQLIVEISELQHF